MHGKEISLLHQCSTEISKLLSIPEIRKTEIFHPGNYTFQCLCFVWPMESPPLIQGDHCLWWFQCEYVGQHFTLLLLLLCVCVCVCVCARVHIGIVWKTCLGMGVFFFFLIFV